MSEELKPCPFCAGTSFSVGEFDAINCNNCGCCGPFETDCENLVDAWNTRPIEDALRAENETLRMQLAGCGVAANCNAAKSCLKTSELEIKELEAKNVD